MTRPAKKKTPAKDNGPKWHDGIPALVRSLAGRSKKGLSDDEVAEKLGVAVRTIHRWKKEHPEFLKALLETKAIMDARVEMCLYQRATGYQATKTEVTVEGGQETKRVTKTEDVAPDVTACKLWLTNRDPGRWKDKQDVSVTGDLVINLKAVDMGVPDDQ